jgi:hypothetical protein
VTNRTVGELERCTDAVLFLQLQPLRNLIRGWLPSGVVNLGLRAQELLWVAVTVETPAHVQRLLLVDDRHRSNITVTGRTPHTLGNVNAVVEIHEVRQVVYFVPFNGLVVCVAVAYKLKLGTLWENPCKSRWGACWRLSSPQLRCDNTDNPCANHRRGAGDCIHHPVALRRGRALHHVPSQTACSTTIVNSAL